MKLNKLGLCAVPIALAFTLTGCNYVDAGIKQVQKDSAESAVGPNLDTGKKIETEGASYTKVRASDDLLNSIQGAKVLGGDGEDYGHDSITAKYAVAEYFYRYFIDSTALEGGKKSLEAWKKAAIKQGVLSDTDYSLGWLKDPKSVPVLTTDSFDSTNIKSFIHDGKPRMTDANLTFDDKKIYVEEYPDGWVMTVPTTWDVDYRITDETLLQMIRHQNPKGTDEEILEGLTDEAQDGKGENPLRISGTADFTVLLGEEAKIYAVGHQSKFSYGDAIRPEFQKGGARYNEERPDR